MPRRPTDQASDPSAQDTGFGRRRRPIGARLRPATAEPSPVDLLEVRQRIK